jgi:uncharacterized membrane protein
MTQLTRLHRFLAGQALYPIVLSSILAAGFYAGRVFLSHQWTYSYLVWNLFLAWIPYLASFTAAWLERSFPRRLLPLLLPGTLWLAFLPNAPYLVTDFQHLQPRPPVPLWYDVGLLTVFAWTGLFLAVASLRTMQILVKSYFGRLASWVFVAVTLALSSLGIYLGRFLRWNSWDLLTQPLNILKDVLVRITDPLSHLPFVGFTLMFAALLLVCYLMFLSVHSARDEERG